MSKVQPSGGDTFAPRGQAAEAWTVFQGDARNSDRFLSTVAKAQGDGGAFLSLTITSPPYANIVDYGVKGQIGFAQTYDEYLAECKSVFDAVFRWTKDDGALWIVADSVSKHSSGSHPGGLLPLPFDLASVAAEAGWVLKDVIIWRKDRTRPWSNRGRLRNGFEYVLFFVKTKDYKYRVDRLRDSRALKSWWVRYPERHNPWGMAPDNVWEIPIPVQGSWAGADLRHACPLPEELIRRILLLSSDKGDIVFDPFAGSGMVAAVSEAESRVALGTELNPDFVDAFHKSVRPSVLSGYQPAESGTSSAMTEKLLTLRVLKYPKDLVKQLLREGTNRASIYGVVVDADPFDYEPRLSKYAEVKCVVLVPNETSDIEIQQMIRGLVKAAGRPPLSKYSLSVDTQISRLRDFLAKDEGLPLSIYRRGQTWRTSETWSRSDFSEKLLTSLSEDFPVVISPLFITQIPEEN